MSTFADVLSITSSSVGMFPCISRTFGATTSTNHHCDHLQRLTLPLCRAQKNPTTSSHEAGEIDALREVSKSTLETESPSAAEARLGCRPLQDNPRVG